MFINNFSQLIINLSKNKTKLENTITKFNSRRKYFETEYSLEYLLTDKYLNDLLTDFFKNIQSTLNNSKHISVITRVETTEYDVYTLGNKSVLDLENNDNILNYIFIYSRVKEC